MSSHSTTTSNHSGQPADGSQDLSAGSVRDLSGKLDALRVWFRQNAPVAVALSGGVDSALLASLAHEELGGEAVAVTGVSPSLSQQELESARRLASEVGIRHLELETRELDRESYRANSGDRCYHCKSELYDVILDHPRLNGYTAIDGTQASDVVSDRPGAVAARERGVYSPLRAFGFDKESIRHLARERQLSSHDRPARPCLASRVPVGTTVNAELLGKIEALESVLSGEGFSVYRARCEESRLVVEIAPEELADRLDGSWRQRLNSIARQLGFAERWLDLRGYGGSGSPRLEALAGDEDVG
mgnify:FL=1